MSTRVSRFPSATACVAVWRNDEREAPRAEVDFVDHLPHFLEAELAHEPSVRPIQAHEVNGKNRRRQLVLIEMNRRHGHAIECALHLIFWNRDARLADS